MEENYCPEGMLGSYLYESFQLLEQMEAVVLADGGEGVFDAESINEIFRIVHTIKGTSGIMMYDNIAYVAHKLEDIFYYLRESGSEDILKAELADYVFLVSDFISGELNKIKSGSAPDGDPEKIAGNIETYLTALKEEIQDKGMELPPENVYAPPVQYYVAPVAENKENVPLKIDLGIEPEKETAMKPGDYVIGSKAGKKENLVGIGMEKLDKLTILVEKLLRMEQKVEKKPDSEDMWKKLHKITGELEETVRDMRQAPLSGLFRKMNRVVYDASRRLSKDMELSTCGEELLVDRMILEHLSEPLMHMVRNAADHGIEDLAGRRRMGKTDIGNIQLSASVEDGMLTLVVQDDGRGLDKQQIFERAKVRGLLEEQAQMEEYTEQEIFAFLTIAGFSTRDEVTELSGRGVGMDVAANKVAELGGNLRIESILGEGTEIIMEIPID